MNNTIMIIRLRTDRSGHMFLDALIYDKNTVPIVGSILTNKNLNFFYFYGSDEACLLLKQI